jgi:hypothetical protein
MPCLTYESEQKRAAREEKNAKPSKGSKSKVSVLHSHVFSAFDAPSGCFKYDIALNEICLFSTLFALMLHLKLYGLYIAMLYLLMVFPTLC